MIKGILNAVGLAIACLSLSACGAVASLTGPTHQFVLEVDAEKLPADEDRGAVAQATKEVLTRRLEGSGVTVHAADLTREGRLVLDVSGSNSADALRQSIGITGEMAFRMVDMSAQPDQLAQGIVPPGSELLPSREGYQMAVKRLGALRGRHLVDARAGIDPFTDRPVVNIKFDEEGGRKLTELTQANVGQPMAMVLDGEVLSAPIIREPITGGQLQISGGFSNREANQLAIALRSGALPAPVTIIEERELGSDSE